MMMHPISRMVATRAEGSNDGLVSVCSAHPRVITVALIEAARHGLIALIEATCNQVNQEGGYTGMQPAEFRQLVLKLARDAGVGTDSLILGGDHLGPNPWRNLPADEAMARAEVMIAAYAAAGFTKLHLDCSMGCKGEAAALEDDEVAKRAVRLCRAAEAAVPAGAPRPVYIIGTEVPVPGGATGPHAVEVTSDEAARRTLALHQEAFDTAGLADVFQTRVHGLVVQPGIEFDNSDVLRYRPEDSANLSRCLADTPGIVFEAHSTDYQTPAALAALVRDGFAILKVGPALTFAMREALYGLDRMAGFLGREGPTLVRTMEELMLAEPGDWAPYCRDDDRARAFERHYGLSDRIRYYWQQPQARVAEAQLLNWLSGSRIDTGMFRACLPQLWGNRIELDEKLIPEQLIHLAIAKELRPYYAATSGKRQ